MDSIILQESPMDHGSNDMGSIRAMNTGTLDPVTDSTSTEPLSQESANILKTGALMSPPLKLNHVQPRPTSFSLRPGNRLSLSLPIQVGDKDLYGSSKLTPTSSDPSTRQASPVAEVSLATSLNDSNDFLVALAAQERRVLELKEELFRAERELKKLKTQWAIHETGRNVVRSRAEIKVVELRAMQPITTGAIEKSMGNGEEIPVKRSLESDRRKTIMTGMTRDSRRKVISGGHTRTLSLLSPVQPAYSPVMAGLSALDVTRGDAATVNTKSMTREDRDGNSVSRVRHSYHDSATSGVKQIAEDIKSGLWSFMEDLRQATVGDEAIRGIPEFSANSTQRVPVTKTGNRSPIGAETDPWRAQGQRRSIPRSQPTKAMIDTALMKAKDTARCSEPKLQTPQSAEKRHDIRSSLDDDWLNWDSSTSHEESGRWSNSTALSSQHGAITVSPPHEPKVLRPTPPVGSMTKHDEIPWPDLKSLTPNNFKRTASAFIKEWEKSLIPPSENPESLMSSSSNAKRKLNDDSETRLLWE